MVNLKLKLPPDFLKEEERCGYLVSGQMKEIWAVELDLFAEFDRVCKKHNITYFASSGTMLGAVRHKGFIPWDDDMDFMLHRTEYDKLCAVAEKEFQHPYFFQTEWTDRGTLRGHAQLRNSLTTGILKKDLMKKLPYNQGIFIDIFPMDAVCDDSAEFERNRQEAQKVIRKFTRIASLTNRFYTPEQKDFKFYLKSIAHAVLSGPCKNLVSYDKYFREYENLMKLHNNEQTKMLGLLGLHFTTDYLRYRSDFEEVTELPFEFLKMPVPKNYDHALHHIYGDYMKFVRGQGQQHGGMIMDTSQPYTKYFES